MKNLQAFNWHEIFEYKTNIKEREIQKHINPKAINEVFFNNKIETFVTDYTESLKLFTIT